MEGKFTRQFSADIASNVLLQRAQTRVLDLFNRHADARLVFHNYPFTTALAGRVMEIAQGEGATIEGAETAQLAAWFLCIGHTVDYRNPAQHSLQEAERFLIQERYPEDRRREVLLCLQSVLDKQPLPSTAARLLSDAFQLSAFVVDFAQRSPLLRLEWEFLLHRQLSASDWAKLQLQYLLQVQLHTHYSRANYEPLLAELIHRQKEQVESLEKDTPAVGKEEDPSLFQKLEKKRFPFRATQTYFRTNYRNHINLSSIADNKANIMISVNSILISVLITILTYRNITETQPMVLLPVVIFLVTGLASLIFAVLSARPKVTALNRLQTDPLEIRKNIVFFGNFVHLDLEEYEEAMDALFRSDELLYGNMTRDLYYLGKVLDKKYRYLAVSYNIFMVGFIATVGTFLFLLLR